MKAEIENLLEDINKSLKLILKRIDLENSKSKLDKLNHLSEDPNLWKDKKKAQQLMKERRFLNSNINEYENLLNQYNENLELLELADEENDLQFINEIEIQLKDLKKNSNYLEITSLLARISSACLYGESKEREV